jgi:hypothetical protein
MVGIFPTASVRSTYLPSLGGRTVNEEFNADQSYRFHRPGSRTLTAPPPH